MIFHSIDNKSNCKNIIVNNKIIVDPSYDNLTGSWDYNTDHNNDQIQYAKLYLQGKSLDDVCPLHLKEEWEKVKDKHAKFIKTFKTANVQASDYCFYDLVPESFLLEYFGHKCKIIEHVLQRYEKPNNYNHLLELTKLIKSIEENSLNIDLSSLSKRIHKAKTRRFREKIGRTSTKISYNIFGTKTGRLATNKRSFPILTLDKDHRSILKSSNDFIIELDFNGAELRSLLALNNVDQPQNDIHEWHHQEIMKSYGKDITREEIKKKIFAWLYGGLEASLGIPSIEKFYNKKSVVNEYWDGEKITNPFGREIECDKFHALNFLIQSTTSDLFLRRAVAVHNLLKGKKTKIIALIHDSMLLDFCKEEKEMLPNIIETFSNTDFGTYKVNKKIGLDFGNMRSF